MQLSTIVRVSIALVLPNVIHYRIPSAAGDADIAIDSILLQKISFVAPIGTVRFYVYNEPNNKKRAVPIDATKETKWHWIFSSTSRA